MSLRKIVVCDKCISPTVTDVNCTCNYDDYMTIELEFEVCDHCGSVDNEPAETEFNVNQMKHILEIY